MTKEYSRVGGCSEGPRTASRKRRNTPSYKHVVHTLRRASIDVQGASPSREAPRRNPARAEREGPKEDLLAAPSMDSRHRVTFAKRPPAQAVADSRAAQDP